MKTYPYLLVRGGSWYNSPHDARLAVRGRNSPGYHGSLLGFRLVRSEP